MINITITITVNVLHHHDESTFAISVIIMIFIIINTISAIIKEVVMVDLIYISTKHIANLRNVKEKNLFSELFPRIPSHQKKSQTQTSFTSQSTTSSEHWDFVRRFLWWSRPPPFPPPLTLSLPLYPLFLFLVCQSFPFLLYLFHQILNLLMITIIVIILRLLLFC